MIEDKTREAEMIADKLRGIAQTMISPSVRDVTISMKAFLSNFYSNPINEDAIDITIEINGNSVLKTSSLFGNLYSYVLCKGINVSYNEWIYENDFIISSQRYKWDKITKWGSEEDTTNADTFISPMEKALAKAREEKQEETKRKHENKRRIADWLRSNAESGKSPEDLIEILHKSGQHDMAKEVLEILGKA